MTLDLEETRKSIENYVSSVDKSSVNQERIFNLLVELKGSEMTKDILTKSKIGVSVNKLRKCEDEKVQKIATEILLTWKDVMMPAKRKLESEDADENKKECREEKGEEKKGEEEKGEEKKGEEEKGEEEKGEEEKGEEEKGDTFKEESKSIITGTSESPSTPQLNGSCDIKEYFTGDAVRDKCLEMLVTALMTDQSEGQNPDELIINTAQGIERSLFNEFKSTSPAYKSKFRSKYLNLKDKNNPTLRSGLISGMITPERFISMTLAEMASDERRRINSLMSEQNMLNSQMAKDNAAETDQFKCGRCNQRKCKYYQMQTRSADEPMTTFVTCINCGNRWRVGRAEREIRILFI